MEITELLAAPGVQRDLAWLKDALQAAIELEFFTIPPYLTAMWSVEDPSHPAAAAIRAVVYEEMQHMALACNMLVAVGGAPQINYGTAVPRYPAAMPGGVKPELRVGLGGLTPESVQIFMDIEAPETPLEFPDGFETIGVDETFPRIGAFYDAIRDTFDALSPKISVDRQLTGPLAPMVVATIDDVRKAIHVICVQGEGTDVDPAAVSPRELAHYYRFQELDRGCRLEYSEARKAYAWGPPKSFPFPKAYPVAPIPPGGYRYDRVSGPVAADLEEFDRAYTRMLDELQAAWGAKGQAALWRAVEWMFALEKPARSLMQRPIPNTKPPKNYGPNFRYLGGV